jgi:protein-S-isoprenylcysteine O-methyltransferase Ste14
MIQTLSKLTETVLAMAGILVRRLTALHALATGLSLVTYQFFLLPRSNLQWAIWYFAFATVIHYILLFGIFARNRKRSWAQWLINRYGEEKGFVVFEMLMAFVFCHNGLSSAYICSVAGGLESIPTWFLLATGVLFSLIGFSVKLWATMVVGIDTYYYKDLFWRRAVSDFKVAGPYRVFKNPMYGIGHLHAYGIAMMSGSLAGLIAVAFNQACIWSFYLLIEKPHVHEMYGEAGADANAVESAS